MYEVTGLVEVPGKGVFNVSALIEARSGKERRISAVPLSAVPFDSLRASANDAERHAAAALEHHINGAKSGYAENKDVHEVELVTVPK